MTSLHGDLLSLEPGTSSEGPKRRWENGARAIATISGVLPQSESSPEGQSAESTSSPGTQQALAELRRFSGLTWAQLGELLGVARRSVHFWASGKPMNADNERRLMGALDVIRRADRGDARATRTALLEVRGGMSAFGLLAEERFAEAAAFLGPGHQRRRVVLAPLDDKAHAARRPPPPASLVDARHEKIHRDPGPARAARTSRGKARVDSR